ncbi:MAG: hypothetical protein HN828_00315 [Candidatus Thioglobus sp.]|jgi:mono/diheme cytochrome c family protein|uniref:hypothetical protein n=1 Tax=Candidatus Thioglobus sp. TaxID=2026721 RepID=UPI0001BD393A|nr:hypothetical protein [Candidatus Thioglobus sp.]EEZ79598.1 MAG: hypothetical protein Sup05_0928 [uncultured Candidatus Thioglobus sp.]MBT3186399.1 hypothetical protein [Candidatus Thioglobus sp.]MBT4316298.1 hypothetical protein [Candidatus Thioglobus sp.]MBT4553468.1 hypothetical protein [Candidatus Thioglobus sp.]MBT4923182.1 hypothetical protein [Candidatus Thioglobus sp.]
MLRLSAYLFLLITLSVQGSDIDQRILIDGEVLYTEECQKCHDNSLVPINDGTSMQSLDDIRWQISTCVTALGIFWMPNDEEDVAQFLNHDFFHFENTEKPDG